MLPAAIPSQHKARSLNQFTAKNISTDSVACLSPIDTTDNPNFKQFCWDQDGTENMLMKLECNRLHSFRNCWPISDIKPESLAAAGFFYLQQEDRVQCPFCQVIIFNWTTGDKPLREHRRKSPKCPFLGGSDVGNIPLVPESHIWSCTGFDYKHPFSSVSASYKPKHSRMADIKDRISTFIDGPYRWPLCTHNPEELAECGFYYSGMADVVICFFCGVTLGIWNPDDNPWVEHSKVSPDCSFLAVTKNKHTASAIKGDAACESKNFHSIEIEDKGMSSLNTCSDIIQRAFDIFPDHAVWDVLKKKGEFSSLLELVDEVLDTEQQSQHKTSVVPENTTSTSVNTTCTASNDEIIQKALDIFPDHKVRDALKKKGKFSSLRELIDEVLDTEQQSQHETSVVPENTNSASVNTTCTASNDVILCKLCMDRERGVVFQPCGHFISCWQCSNFISDCPACRKPIMHKIKAYFC